MDRFDGEAMFNGEEWKYFGDDFEKEFLVFVWCSWDICSLKYRSGGFNLFDEKCWWNKSKLIEYIVHYLFSAKG